MRLPEPTNGTELQNTEESLKFLKHQWKSMRQPTTKSPTVVDSTTTTTTITTTATTTMTMANTTPRALKTTAIKGKPTNGPKVQCKFYFGPREIFQIHKLLEENASNSEQYAEAKVVKSTTEFVKNRTGNSAHINEIGLEALAELVDHPIEHVIHEINLFAFSESEEPNKPRM